MKIETLRLLRCPYCGQPLECLESVQIGDEIEHGILECGCSNFPIVAGIPIFKRDGRLDLMSDTEDTVLRAGPPVRALLELVRSRDFERALLILLIPPLGLPVRLGRLAALLPGRYRERFRDYVATAASAKRKRTYRTLMAQPATAVDVFDFFFRQLHLWRAEMYNYFAYRLGMPRHLAALSLATLLPTSHKPILDLACGFGHLLHYWAMTRPGHPLIGLDRNFFLVWVAREWMVPGADYVCADADQTLPFDRGSLSDAYCSDAFHYFFQKVQCVSELQRVVDEAGVIVLSRVGNVLVKRNEGRFSPSADQREKMDCDMPEVDVQKLRLRLLKNADERIDFTPGNLPWRRADLLEPKSSREMHRRPADYRKPVERVAPGLFPLLRDHDRRNARERSDLPVDVKHLRLQKCRAIEGDHRPFRLRCRTVSCFRQNRNSKNLMPLHLFGSS